MGGQLHGDHDRHSSSRVIVWQLPVALTGKLPRLASRRTKHRPPLSGTPKRRRWLGSANVSTPLVHRAPVEHILSLALALNGGTSLRRGNRSIYQSWSKERPWSIEHIGKQWSEPQSVPERENEDEENRLVTSKAHCFFFSSDKLQIQVVVCWFVCSNTALVKSNEGHILRTALFEIVNVIASVSRKAS